MVNGNDAVMAAAETIDCTRPERSAKAATAEGPSYTEVASLGCPCPCALTESGVGIVMEQGASHDRAIVGIVLGQLLRDALSTPEWVLLVVDDVLQRWYKHLDDLWARAREDWDKHIGRLRVAVNMPEYTILHQFIDSYTHGVEGFEDLPNNTMEEVWFRHALRLAPEGHPIHNNELDRDPGV
jgi:hypothetical protein